MIELLNEYKLVFLYISIPLTSAFVLERSTFIDNSLSIDPDIVCSVQPWARREYLASSKERRQRRRTETF